MGIGLPALMALKFDFERGMPGIVSDKHMCSRISQPETHGLSQKDAGKPQSETLPRERVPELYV